MKTAAIFISHPHIDHIGGLANLFSCIQKLESRYKTQLIRNNTLDIFFPDLTLLEAIKTITFSGRKISFRYTLNEHPLQDGLIYEDDNIRVSALHNNHLKENGINGWHSYSFLIEAEEKRIVFSGDVRSPEELIPLLGSGCDMLIMETGHHDVAQVMEFACANHVENLRLTHHGRQILENRAYYEELATEYTNSRSMNIKLCYDGMQESL